MLPTNASVGVSRILRVAYCCVIAPTGNHFSLITTNNDQTQTAYTQLSKGVYIVYSFVHLSIDINKNNSNVRDMIKARLSHEHIN